MNSTRIGVFFAILAIVVSPLFAAPGYSILEHSISELGAQMTPNAWIMNFGFLLFGLGILVDAVRRLRDAPLGAISFIVFGMSMMFNGVFSHRPIDPDIPYDLLEDQLHSMFSGGVGVAFAVGTLCFAFAEEDRRAKVACVLASAAAVLIPLCMVIYSEVAGLLQRIMFAISFVWLVIFLPETVKPSPSR